jgi:hypothetical protein
MPHEKYHFSCGIIILNPMEQNMKKNYSDDDVEVSIIAESMELPYPVIVSAELSEQLIPNNYLSGLGIRYSDRLKTIFGILKAYLIPKDSHKETLPNENQSIPIILVKGPFIKEEEISINAKLTEDNGEKVIMLTAVLDDD